MCEKCKENAELMQHIENHNAIWQNALALKIVIHNSWLEMQEYGCENYYGDLEAVIHEFLDRINLVEQRSYHIAKEAAAQL